jgi:hypothetical protein
MRTLVAVLTLIFIQPVFAGDDAAEKKPPKLNIIVKGNWNASSADVLAVLKSTAHELSKFFPDRKLEPIEVERITEGTPITLFARGPKGEIRIRLITGGMLWSQYAYQFAHEIGHVYCSYDSDDHKNKWFEESICELSSLFCLRKMSESWKTTPPYANWKSYAPHLREYSDERMKKSGLPEGMTLAKWYEQNASVLTANATDRDRNNVVANALLPFFEEKPERWETMTWLNEEKLTPLYTFKNYLEAWRKHCPDKHKDFVTLIAKQFEIELEK